MRLLPALVMIAAAAPLSARAAPPPRWSALEAGLEFAEFAPCGGAAPGAAPIAVLRADPARFELRLLTPDDTGDG
jgi:hypothetical protein